MSKNVSEWPRVLRVSNKRFEGVPFAPTFSETLGQCFTARARNNIVHLRLTYELCTFAPAYCDKQNSDDTS